MSNTTELTDADRALLDRVAPLHTGVAGLHLLYDKHNSYVCEVNVRQFNDTDNQAFARALCIVVNGYRRQEVALRLVCRDMVQEVESVTEERVAKMINDYLETADRQIDYQSLIDMRNAQEEANRG